MSLGSIAAYGAYIPRRRVQRAEIAAAAGARGGNGARVVASFDEDSTTLGVEASRRALASGASPAALYFATTSPAYLDKTNAAAIHAALDLQDACFAADMAGSARSGIAALQAARASAGLAVLADIRVGRPGSSDERNGGDGAAAFIFGEPAIAEIIAEASTTAEFLDRWRAPAEAAGHSWEERFGLELYQSLIKETVARVLPDGERPEHVVLVCPNEGVVKRAAKLVAGTVSTSTSPIGHAGAADAGLGLAAALDRAQPGERILLVSAVDGCDAMLLRATERLATQRANEPVTAQLALGYDIPYLTYLAWRGLLEREAPRRPEPDLPAAPPAARSRDWKFSFTGSRCAVCGFVNLPPTRVCKKCGAVDRMERARLAETQGTIATFTVDRLAYSLSPPLIDAVVDFDGGGRYTLELADTSPDQLVVGARVALTFRRLYTTNGVHNYFWKARVM